MATRRAILIGAVESTRIAFEALQRSPDWVVAAVVTLDEGLAARHSDFQPLGPIAAVASCAVIAVDNINHDAALAAVGAIDADCVFVIGWSQIVGARFLDLWKDRVVGYHPAALPRMRGRAAIPWTILSGDPITAGTLFWVDRGTDTGAILDQHFFHVAPDETAATLYEKHMAALAIMLDRSLPMLAGGHAPRLPQDEACATWAARRTSGDGRIDWTQSAATILRLVRAAGRPYPGAWTRLNGSAMHIWSARATAIGAQHWGRAGQVIDLSGGHVCVLCGDGHALLVTETTGLDRAPRLHAVLGE
uniref:methionyl-tRNA formyltransferase n=1 Tax=uncultured Sphingomonas sp. TaxID=158754 RepID=UPI0035CA4F4B